MPNPKLSKRRKEERELPLKMLREAGATAEDVRDVQRKFADLSRTERVETVASIRSFTIDELARAILESREERVGKQDAPDATRDDVQEVPRFDGGPDLVLVDDEDDDDLLLTYPSKATDVLAWVEEDPDRRSDFALEQELMRERPRKRVLEALMPETPTEEGEDDGAA